MSWLASLFGGNKRAAGRSNALSSTRDAFSMPSPVLSPQQDAYEPESSTSYTYPPQQNGQAYGYVPAARRGSSLLPTHNASANGGYPPLAATWNRLKTWLANEYPELGDTLNYAILPQDLQELEAHFGFALPPAVRESYLVVDGQEPESSAACSEGLFFGLHLLPLEEVYDEWRFWRDVDGDPDTAGHDRLRSAQQSIPPGWVRREYSNRGWLPLVSDKAGNYIGVDLNPDERGAAGQVIVFGRDFDTKVVLANGDGSSGWARWLAAFADMLEGADGYELTSGDTDSQGSEDDIGYQSYFDTGGESADQRGPRGWSLTGEYRGWPPLEAFADRGVRRWMEAGLVPEFSAQEKGKAPEDGPNVLDLAKVTADADDANGTLSVYAKPENSNSPEDMQPSAEGASSRAVPSISVTKPPAPRPVLLPTENDILASPSNFEAPSPADVESGFAVPMAQYKYDPPPSAASPITTAKNTPAADSSMFVPPAPAAAPLSDITDLLTESGPALETAALEPAPSAPTSGQVSPVATPSPVADLLSGDEAAVATPEKSEEEDEQEDDDEEEDDEEEDEEELVKESGASPALAADDANAKTASS